MSLIATVVASLVPRVLGTIGRNVAHLSTVEATEILSPCLVDHLPGITFESVIFAVPSDVTRLSDVNTG